MADETAVLIISGFGVWKHGEPKVGKIESHLSPIGAVADRTVFVCTGPTAESVPEIDYRQIAPSRWKLLTLFKQFLLALKLSVFEDFDVIVTYSLIPYGMFGLVTGGISRTPVHLGIIGSDLDVHAHGRYRTFVRWCFRQFDTISVKGETYEKQLIEYGVDPKAIFHLYNPPDKSYLSANPKEDPTYDLLWLTRMSEEKNPLLFVEILSELDDRGVQFNAAMVGSGPLEDTIRDAVEDRDLGDRVDMPGWATNPKQYYEDSSIYVLTSTRDMLPISLLEAMYCGAVPVAPAIGAIPDVIRNEENGILIEENTVENYVEELTSLLENDKERDEIRNDALRITQHISHDASAEKWDEILDYALLHSTEISH